MLPKVGTKVRYEKSISTGPLHDPAETEKARSLVAQCIQQVQEKYRVNAKNVFLFGFSQGAILSYAVALTQPELIGGVACMNGRILPEHVPQKPFPAIRDFPILVSHGTEDEILSIDYARSAKAILNHQFVDLTYSSIRWVIISPR